MRHRHKRHDHHEAHHEAPDGTEHGDRRFARPPHHEHDHGRHHRGGRDGRLARLFEHGDLKMLILHLIAEKPRHGYEIIKAIEDLAGGAYAPSPGVIYPTLTLLEDIGQIASTAEGNRKSYAITDPGKTALAESQPAVTAILERIAATKPREAAMPVMRAMENIKTALRLKLGGDALTPETVRKVADALDEAARKIEES